MKRKNIPIHTDELEKLGLSVEPIDIDQSKAHLLKAHRDDHYIFIWQQQGSFRVIIDFNTVTLKDACLVCIRPGQVHYYLPQKNAGWILEVSPDIIEKDFRNYLDKLSTPVVSVTDSQSLSTLVELIDKSCNASELNSFGVKGLHACLNAFVSVVCNTFSSTQDKHLKPQSRLSQITAAFRQLLEGNFRTLKKPADYAALLSISTAYLNEVLIKTTGFSTSHWIQQHLFLEAKRLLHHTELSSKEKAFELGFEDPAYFARLFKKVNGLTPMDFRKACHDLSG